MNPGVTLSFDRLKHRFGVLRDFNLAEWFCLVQALIAIPVVTVQLKLTGLKRTQRRLAEFSRMRAALPSRGTPDTWVRSVDRAAAYGLLRPNCLQRSLVLWLLMRRRGFEPDLRIGVAPPSSEEGVRFHAWLELDGSVINDRPTIAREFLPFGEPVMPEMFDK